jgi:hypothetical protein
MHLLWQERRGRQQLARRPGAVVIAAELVAVTPGVREHLDDSARIMEKSWRNRMNAVDLRALSPLIYSQVNQFDLDMSKRFSTRKIMWRFLQLDAHYPLMSVL